MKKYLPYLAALLLGVGLVTQHARSGDLTNYDDERYIAGNPYINGDVETGENIWTAYFDGHYHPLTLLSLKWDTTISDDPIRAHHTVNWWLHLLNVLSVFALLLLLSGDARIAFAVALLWGLHPVAVESYAWMTERKNVLYAFFTLWSSIFYVRYLKSEKSSELALTGIAFLLACFSKGQGILLVPTFVLLHYVTKGSWFNKKALFTWIPFAAVALIFAFVNRQAQSEAWDLTDQTYGTFERLVMGSYALVLYILHTVFPGWISPYYPYPADVGKAIDLHQYASLLIWPALFVGMRQLYKSGNRLAFFAAAWFLLHIVLLLKILPYPYGAYFMADRYAYLPMIGGLYLVIEFFFHGAAKHMPFENAKYALTGIFAVLYGVMTYHHINTWNNSVSLWTKVQELYPNYPHAYNMGALGALAQGDAELAVDQFKTMDALDSNGVEAVLNLAVLYEQRGQPDRADEYVEEARRRDSTNSGYIEKAALIQLRRGELKEALKLTGPGIERYPDSPELILIHSQVIARMGDPAGAEAFLADKPQTPEITQLRAQLRQIATQEERRRTSSPEQEEAQRLMQNGIAHARNGNIEEAINSLNRAVEVAPNLYSTYANRGSFYAQNGQDHLAEQDFLKAVELNPSAGSVHAMLGLYYANHNQPEKSCYHYANALENGVNLSEDVRQQCGL